MTEPNLDPIAAEGLRNVRANIRPPRHATTDPDPVRARAIQRARNEHTKDTP